MKIKNNKGEYTQTAISKVSLFFNECAAADSFSNRWRLLSSLYSSRSTNYHSILNSDIFEQSSDQAVITAAGFSKTAKRVIRLNLNNLDTLSIMSLIAERGAEKRQAQLKFFAEKEAIYQAVHAEADSIVIDDEFKSALKWAAEADGSEKSDRMASAMKGLLSRNNIELIKSDFWKVFRILKEKSETI